MNSLAQNSNEFVFQANKVWVSEDSLYVLLVDGREIKVPLEYYPSLRDASKKDLESFELIGEGTAIHWPAIDEDLSIEGIVLGIPSIS